MPILAHVGARKGGPSLLHGLVRAMRHGAGQIRFWAKDFFSVFIKCSSFWAEIFSVLGQASVSVMGQNSDKNIQLSFMISVFLRKQRNLKICPKLSMIKPFCCGENVDN
jgi:hypothetical protein